MSELEILAQQQNVARKSDGQWLPPRGTRDGAMFTADWLTALTLEGRVFGMNGASGGIGYGSSPITFEGVYAATSVDIGLDVPDGTVVIPISIEVNLQTTGGSLFEVFALASRTLQATSGATAGTIVPFRTDAPVATNCTGYITDGDVTATDPNTTGSYEFWRSGYPSDPDVALNPNPRYSWSAINDGVGPVIVGPGSLALYVSGTSGVGFATVIWAELPESAIA